MLPDGKKFSKQILYVQHDLTKNSFFQRARLQKKPQLLHQFLFQLHFFKDTHTYIHLGQIHLPLMDRPSVKGVIKKTFLFFIRIQMKNKKVFLMSPLTDGPSVKVR